MRFEKEFRNAYPETIGETDKEFDMSNYCDWLESLVEEKFTSNNKPSAQALQEIAARAYMKGKEVSSNPKLVICEDWFFCVAQQLRALV